MKTGMNRFFPDSDPKTGGAADGASDAERYIPKIDLTEDIGSMKNTFGTSVAVTLCGESHGSSVSAVLDGLAPGIPVDEEKIRHFLSLRRPSGRISTARVERDPFVIESGVYRGRTTGTPILIRIPNENIRDADYERQSMLARPGHADFTAQMKYHGFQDARGGGHFSGRLTAALTAAGAIAACALEGLGIRIGTHILRLADVKDRSFSEEEDTLARELEVLGDTAFPVLDSDAAERMRAEILAARQDGDSIGGILETAVTGMPAGVGEPWFDTVEGVLAHALFSIPAVKGLEFGAGFGMASLRGSEANDALRVRAGRIVTVTNHNGGINGGITNGMPLLFRTAIKPTPSIFRPQETVDLAADANAILSLTGRHDPAIIHRARIVCDSVTALVLCDLLALRFGTDFLSPDANLSSPAASAQNNRTEGQGVSTNTQACAEQERPCGGERTGGEISETQTHDGAFPAEAGFCQAEGRAEASDSREFVRFSTDQKLFFTNTPAPGINEGSPAAKEAELPPCGAQPEPDDDPKLPKNHRKENF